MFEKRKRREGVKRRSGSPYWWASYSDASGKRVQRSTGTTDKREALNLLNKWKTEVWNQQARGIEPDRTFEQLVVLYLKETAGEKRSSNTDVSRFKVLASYFPEGLLMNELTVVTITGYITYRQALGIANKTINKELSLLSSSIKWSRKKLAWDLPNPVVGQRLVEENREARCLSIEEFNRLLKGAKAARSGTRDYLPEFCILGFNTMMRPGEMLALEWDRVDLKEKVIYLGVEHTKGRAKRLVPLNEQACAVLLRLRAHCDRHFPDTPYVFTHTRSQWFGKRIATVGSVFETAAKRAKIEHVTPHALRHTGITEGVHAPGANVVDISRVAGHKDLQTTMGYIHTAPSRLHEAVAKLPSIGSS